MRTQTNDMLKPQVALVDNAQATELLERDEALLDLSDITCGCARSILCELTPDQASALATTD